MASKILSFICHVPGVIPGAYPAVPTSSTTTTMAAAPKSSMERQHADNGGGHFTAIYENDKFVRFKYIHNPA
ncbi:hypothetical protein [Hymenobacter latericus]|uniref:hypothetical protein n=1 Tax=Hymenobacter sp. YIM 151858-1 TaxID=2987688 RepID=UPI002226251F|nr:hypothetical protein [Hymenobacter sp. YIM 151858-1]UYZ60936.1 hypothetical protein OIS50_09055 [Hymenobacter sp. YIM 151858-1]